MLNLLSKSVFMISGSQEKCPHTLAGCMGVNKLDEQMKLKVRSGLSLVSAKCATPVESIVQPRLLMRTLFLGAPEGVLP